MPHAFRASKQPAGQFGTEVVQAAWGMEALRVAVQGATWSYIGKYYLQYLTTTLMSFLGDNMPEKCSRHTRGLFRRKYEFRSMHINSEVMHLSE